MSLKGLPGGHYQPLNHQQVENLHAAALSVLEKTGFSYEAGLDETIAMTEEFGMQVDPEHNRVYFPRDKIMELVNKAPQSVVLYSRDGENDLHLEDDRVYLGTGGAAIKILDLETGESRHTTLKDLYNLGRLVDQLDNIHFFLRPCIPKDIPEERYDENVFYTCLKATAKHVMAGVNDIDGFHKMLDIASMVAGNLENLKARPFVSLIASFAISPLRLCTHSTRIMQEAARHQIPVALSCAPMAGVTSPITMAGTLVQTHAEQLAGIAICQMTRPGSPVLYGGIPGRANLWNLGYQGGSVECGMMNAAIHQLANHVKVPNYNSSGLTDAKIPDAQAGWEKAMTTMLAAMGGSNFVHHAAGMLNCMITVAHEQFVIDDEIIGLSCKVMAGIPTDPEYLALEIIDAAARGADFIKSAHTMKYMKSEYFNGNGVTDTKNLDKWIKAGSLDAWIRARNIAKKILAQSDVDYMPAEVDSAIRQKYDIRLEP
ncbi:MAG: trimethylamine methyltransferase family protein [Desulfobacterales bacterium]|jgi:trimethylamine--corrinoid protein Co-methyltransferase